MMDPQNQAIMQALAGTPAVNQGGMMPQPGMSNMMGMPTDPLANGQNASSGVSPLGGDQASSLATPQDMQAQMLQALMQPAPPASAPTNYFGQ